MQSRKSKRIILGGGIAGLLQAYFDPEADIITDQIGGQFSSRFQLGPKYLHVDEATTRFFEEINFKPDTKKIKIGFYYDGTLHSENTEENRKKYFEKTRGSSSEPYKSVMSANKTEFDSFIVGMEDLVELLQSKITNTIILERVEGIDLENKEVILKSGNQKYDKLVSTIPMNVFLFLCKKPDFAKLFQSYPTTFVLSDIKYCPFDDFQNFDYVYDSSPEHKYHRLTKIQDGVVFEYKGDNVEPVEGEKDRVVLKVGQLIQNNINIDLADIDFFGRFATWNHGIKTNELLKQLYESKRDI